MIAITIFLTKLPKHEYATGEQIEYLYSLRRDIGSSAWNGALALLFLTETDVQNLTKPEADQVINLIKYAYTGDE